MSKRLLFAALAGIITLTIGVLAVRTIWFIPNSVPDISGDQPTPDVVTSQTSQGEYFAKTGRRLSGPFTHRNLTFYLVHGKDTMSGPTPLTLEEAMNRKLVVVHETGNVNELTIENVSKDQDIFVQAGDIVRGGQQDRVLAVDLIVPPRSGKLAIDSFCVESGRWNTRGSESGSQFNSAEDYVPSKDLKIASKHNKSQSEVWSKVSDSQEKLDTATNSNTASNVSSSSLPLTMKNRNVVENAENYARFLSDIVSHKSEIIGIAMVINGEINSADTYGSSSLFIKLWPKLLRAASIEALSEAGPNEKVSKVTQNEIESFFEAIESLDPREKQQVTERISLSTRESETSLFFESSDRGTVLHRSYILK